jgi:hypothetical protein
MQKQRANLFRLINRNYARTIISITLMRIMQEGRRGGGWEWAGRGNVEK